MEQSEKQRGWCCPMVKETYMQEGECELGLVAHSPLLQTVLLPGCV